MDRFMKPLKMYIFIKKSLPSHKVLGAAHGVLIAHLKFQDNEVYQDWLKNSFRKVVCEVTDAEFEELKSVPDHIIVTESWLRGAEISMVFCPRQDWPSDFKTFPLLNV